MPHGAHAHSTLMHGNVCLMAIFLLIRATEVLIAGMIHGSYVRYEGDRTATPPVRNHPDARTHPQETAQLVVQEVQLGRMIGPFHPHQSPLPYTKISPLN